MMDTVTLRISGGTMIFVIQSHILEHLGLDKGDPIEIEVFYENGESYVINRIIRAIGTSLGVSLKKDFCDKLELKEDQLLQVDLRKPK